MRMLAKRVNPGGAYVSMKLITEDNYSGKSTKCMLCGRKCITPNLPPGITPAMVDTFVCEECLTKFEESNNEDED